MYYARVQGCNGRQVAILDRAGKIAAHSPRLGGTRSRQKQRNT